MYDVALSAITSVVSSREEKLYNARSILLKPPAIPFLSSHRVRVQVWVCNANGKIDQLENPEEIFCASV